MTNVAMVALACGLIIGFAAWVSASWALAILRARRVSRN